MNRKGITSAASPNQFKKNSPTCAPKTPMRFLVGCSGVEFQLASLGLKVTRLRNKSTAAATSRTASTSLTWDFLPARFFGDLLVIADAKTLPESQKIASKNSGQWSVATGQRVIRLTLLTFLRPA